MKAGLGLGLGLVLFAFACDGGTDPGEEVGDTEDTGSDTSSDTSSDTGTEGPTWDDAIAEIFVARCLSCHDWADDYDVVTVGLEQTRFKLENGHGALSQEELDEVLAWIDNGAPK